MTGTALAFGFVLAISVCADVYELQRQPLDPFKPETSMGIHTMGQFPRAMLQPEESLSAEPKYQSEFPVYVVVTFGSGVDNKYTIVFDESRGTGTGYDTLYADRNNNGNLTDDPKIPMRLRQQDRLSGMIMWENFGHVEVLVKHGDKEVPYSFFVEFYRYSSQRMERTSPFAQNVSMRLQPGDFYTGTVSFNGSKLRIAVIDYNGNGLFNEYFKPRSDLMSPDGRIYAVGDQVAIDINGDGVFNEVYPCARYIQVNGKWYVLNISDDGGKVEVQTPQLDMGTIKVASAGCESLAVVSDNGVMNLSGKGQEFRVPVGTYQLYAYMSGEKSS